MFFLFGRKFWKAWAMKISVTQVKTLFCSNESFELKYKSSNTVFLFSAHRHEIDILFSV
jgi:hypothetical protein